ncbi:transposase, IS605 OrfB family, central region [Anopheles sinensis]|uniref:Transposase, IS605 OrfB family, central region n=1 Tax=Anopheles sinensis TaxID=74873 RepID=A0A084W1W9_ANOSI|nr:transposase, IS605 OrfB family, central region [Anopheles sinensis]
MCMEPRVAITAIAPGYSARLPATTGTIGTGGANLDACERSCQGPSGNEYGQPSSVSGAKEASVGSVIDDRMPSVKTSDLNAFFSHV